MPRSNHTIDPWEWHLLAALSLVESGEALLVQTWRAGGKNAAMYLKERRGDLESVDCGFHTSDPSSLFSTLTVSEQGQHDVLSPSGCATAQPTMSNPQQHIAGCKPARSSTFTA